VILAACLICIVDALQKLMVYLIRNAYIIIAKDGTPFLKSGKRAFKLLSENIQDVIALNHFGDIVLFVCRLLITLIAGFVGFVVLSKVIMMNLSSEKSKYY
jgi:choline transporter-like protein 2/4/5